MLDADLDVVRRLHRRAYALPEEGDLPADEEQELHRHIVVVAYRALLRLMVREGFRIEYARGFGYYPFPSLFARPLARLDPSHAHHLVVKGRKAASPGRRPENQPVWARSESLPHTFDLSGA